MNAERLTRRRFVERALGLGLGASAVGGLLAACGGEPAPTASPTASPLPPLDTALPKELHLFNWSDYMAPGIKRGFYETYGIKVVEHYFDDGEALLDVFRRRNGFDGMDVVIPSDYMVQDLVANGYRTTTPAGTTAGSSPATGSLPTLQPLRMELIPNVAYVIPKLGDPPFDRWPDAAKYSVPYQWGTTGIAVRTDRVSEPITRWSQLFPPEGDSYQGKIQMLNDERECLAAALIKNGYSINNTEATPVDEATDDLIAQKPLVRAYDSVSMKRAMIEGVAVVHCWNGDVLMAWDAGVPRQKLDFVHPLEGFPIWVDNMCIPAGAPSPYAAHLFMDYICEPKVNAALTNWTWYFSPIAEAAQYVDERILSIMPTEKELGRGEVYESVGDLSRVYYDAWAQVKES